MRTFQLIALTPPGLIDPSIAIAANRAGGLGVLDLEFAKDKQSARAAIARLARYVKKACGLKTDGMAEDFFDFLMANLPEQVEVVILTPADPDSLRQYVEALHDRNITVLLETTGLEQALLGVKVGVNGIIAKGHEAGGWVGKETTFILLQRLLSQVSLPVWAQGGIGLHTAAGCYAAGAAGVVLDAQLALTRESTLPEQAKASIMRMDGSETICLGEGLETPCRVYTRPGLVAVEALRKLEKTLIEDSRPRSEVQRVWCQEFMAKVGWEDQDKNLWPLGQDAAFAAPLAERFRTVGGVLEGIRQAIDTNIKSVRTLKPLDEKSPLARSHGTRYPVVQGPMAQVSDRAAFAARVAENGALPFLGVGIMRAKEMRPLFEETRQLLGNHPWGAGILGFVPLELHQEQLEVIRTYHPPFVLIAGGRPDQARGLEEEGISTYLHVPSPGLLKLYIENGVRRFIFEGRECGGHIGPRSSFVLWNLMIDALLEALPHGEADACHILFAGGIHDSLSSCMIAALAAPLSDLGVRVGVLLGTAYLFTQEAVATGAIVKGFQEEAVRCQQTVVLETGPGHASRCAATPYAETFHREKQRLLVEENSPEKIRNTLEKLNMGRLRVASKGITRHPDYRADSQASRHIALKDEEQRVQGMYMIGQVATLRNQVCTINELHHEVSVAGSQRVAYLDDPALSHGSSLRSEQPSPSDVAIVGMACILPKASNLQIYWENILNKVDAITEVPKDRWDWRLYYDPSPKAHDKVYSKWGGFIDAIPFDPMRYGMPPNTLASIEPLQLLTLETVRAALLDAGYSDRPFARERTSVILGVGGSIPELGQQYAFRSNLPMFFKDLSPNILNRLPEWTEDSFPGILHNVTAGRVANRFDFGGVNYTVDAACASSLAAVYLAVKELENGTSDIVVVGGGDTSQNPFAYLCFSKTQALSPTGQCRAFDETADGTVISEGVAALVLKRLYDAERDGDRIYAVIKAVGGSSDGYERGLAAPRPEGQKRAIDRAYAKAGFSAATVGLIEGHGTGTVAGDRAEIETLKAVFQAADTPPLSCALGSVKSMIGHTKCTAGVAALIKAALALYHKALPPTSGVTKSNDSLSQSPLYINTKTRPWIGTTNGQPRRAGVSSFGFGGTNFHAVLEEYTGDFLDAAKEAVSQHWPAELFFWAARSREKLLTEINSLIQALEQGARPALHDLAYTLWQHVKERFEPKLAIVATSLEDLKEKLTSFRKALKNADSSEPIRIRDPRGIYFSEEPLAPQGKVAFLFPGQGSQRPGMLGDLAIHFQEVREQFELADQVLSHQFPELFSSYIFPPPCFVKEDKERCRHRLAQTNVTQPAIGAASMGMFQLLRALGARPDMVAGHSYGEYVALCAAGVFDERVLYDLSETRGRFIKEASGRDIGIMAAVEATPKQIEEIVESVEGVWIANLNSLKQTVLSGTRSGVEESIRLLKERGIRTTPIAVSGAFHSPLMAPVEKHLDKFLDTVDFATPLVTVFSNTLAAPYPQDPKDICSLLGQHLIQPVKFAEEVEAMYQDGARIFIEVGPRNILTNLTRQILSDKPHLAVALDIPGRSGRLQLQHALGQLAAHGVKIKLDRLYHGRKALQLNLETLVEETREQQTLPPTTWLVDGGKTRPSKESIETKASKASMVSPMLEKASDSEGIQSGAASNPFSTAEVTMAPLESDSASSGDEVELVMHRFQGLMEKFLEAQKQVMLAYLKGSTDEATLPSEIKHSLSMLSREPTESKASMVSPEPATTSDASETVSSSGPLSLHEAPPAVAEKDHLTKQLLQIVSDRTGYPMDMLDLDLNIEVDLGIDSIKRVEIFTTLEQDFPHIRQGQTESAMEEWTRIKTLRGIVEWINGPAESQPDEQSKKTFHEQSQVAAYQSSIDKIEDCCDKVRRFLLTAVESPLTDRPLQIPSGAVFLITDEERGIAKVMADELRILGVCAVLVQMGDQVEKAGQDLYKADLADPDAVGRLIELIKHEQGPISGIIHLLPLKDRPSFEAMSLDDWKTRVRLEIKSLFYLAKALGKDSKKAAESGMGWLIAATAMGGTFASDMEKNVDFFPGQGGVAGFVKTLAMEMPNLHCKIVDLDIGDHAKTLAGFLLHELASGDEDVEIGYKNSCRFVLKLKQAPLNQETSPTSLQIDSNWVILVTGGARGIMAEVAHELAKRYQPNILLVGRSPLPEEEEPAETVGLVSPKELKAILIDRMRKAGHDAKPAQVEAAYKKLCRDREMQKNLKALQKAGARVQYYQVDVRDEQAFGALLEEIYNTYGRLDGLIHGAGIINDKLVEEKTAESFDRVFDTKADSAFILSHKLLAETLKFLVFFSSVAGRFGNRGQSDYTAANEVLNKMAIYLDHHWPGRVVAINWGPWSKTGMASVEVQRQFAEQGIQVIPPLLGRRMLDEELRYGLKGQVEVVIGDGPWEIVESEQPSSPLNTLPLLKDISMKSTSSGAVEIIRTLDPACDLYLQDHQLDGKPVLPMAMAMELMTQVVKRGWPKWEVIGIHSLKLLKGIVLSDGPQEIRIVASSKTNSAIENTLMEVDVEIAELERTDRPCYYATVQLGETFPIPEPYDPGELSKLRPFPMTVDEAYRRWLFHGPCFQGISEIEGMNEKGICALLLPSSPAECLLSKPKGNWLIDPILIDSAFQLAIIWERAHFDMTPLPSRIKSYRRFGSPSTLPVRCYYEARSLSAGNRLLNTYHFLDEEGKVISLIHEMEASCSKALNQVIKNIPLGRENIQ